jgi:putative transposase
MKRSYQRHLPHEIPEGVPIFVSWNLKAALPAPVLAMLHREKNRLTARPARLGESPRERKIREGKILFGLADRYLDAADTGPMHLKDDRAAKIVEDSILFGVSERYELFAWCVMANHVHLFVKPVIEFKYLMQGIKGFTAHKINGALGTRGETFWQDESYDHWPRDEEEMLRIIHYIEHNPVKAGLCARPEEWRWSSARFRENWPAGEPFRRRSGFPA